MRFGEGAGEGGVNLIFLGVNFFWVLFIFFTSNKLLSSSAASVILATWARAFEPRVQSAKQDYRNQT